MHIKNTEYDFGSYKMRSRRVTTSWIPYSLSEGMQERIWVGSLFDPSSGSHEIDRNPVTTVTW